MNDELRLVRHASPVSFLAEAGEYLVAREAEHNLILGVAGTLRDHPEVYSAPPYLATVRDVEIRLAALRTPPANLVLSESERPDAVDRVADHLASAAADLPGVNAPRSVAARFARAWCARTGVRAVLDVEERIFRLSRVIAPPFPDGGWRIATEQDAPLIGEWFVAFEREALPNEPPERDVEALVNRWVRRIGRTIYLWDLGGEAVSMVGVASPTPHGIRVGPVYTPPQWRGHGYASALTAAVSQHQLDAGRDFCFLFTDVANPTSNHIYQAIGYEPVSDFDMYRFERADGA